MKKTILILTMAVLFLASIELSGCGTKQNAPAPQTADPEKKETTGAEKPASEKPAAEKPKDHPAH